jgi:signal transduction histidine kinase
MTTISASAQAPPMRTVVRQLAVDSRYVLLNFPLALVGFVLLVVGFGVGVGLLVTVIGLPILAGVMYLARGLADLERRRLPGVLREHRRRPSYRRAAPGANWLVRMWTPIAQPQPWLDLAHGVLRLPAAAVTGILALVWWLGALAGTAYVLYDWALPRDDADEGLHSLLGLPDTTGPRVVFYTSLGLFFLFTLPLVVRGCALLDAVFARWMLTSFTGARERISVLEEQRAAAVSAEATALRRLERDIHDGPQQRLVRRAMDLGRAQQQLDTDPAAARETLSEALAQTRETLAELRALSRGIAPPILVDRGLPSALAALAGRSTVPVDLAVDPGLGTATGRLDPAVENAAYFVVAESLTNVAKHSQASECWLTVARAGRRLGIVVADNGAGGAHLAKGQGLAGLADRVRALGGTLAVLSPAGGPTEIRAELPC